MNKETGEFELSPGAIPNLQFWDHVKRNLDKLGADGQAFSKALRGHLDELVPSYKDARSGAAKYFGEEDALNAGAKFATMSSRDAIPIAEARKGLAAMNEAERKLFETGFVSNLMAKVESLKDGQDIVKQIYDSDFAKKQVVLALGPEKAAKLEAHLLAERAMNGLKNAVQGNSTTVRQWVEAGLAGGATTYGGISTYNQDPTQMGIAALAGALTLGSRKIDQRVSRRVAEMLASDDPKVMQNAINMIARSETLRNAFRSLNLPVTRAAAQHAGDVPVLQQLQGPVPSGTENEQR
jgi:hypothetical protein